jgi:hypothetical protein
MLYKAGEGCSTHFFRIGVTLRDGQIISGWFALFRHGINGSSSRNQKKQKVYWMPQFAHSRQPFQRRRN